MLIRNSRYRWTRRLSNYVRYMDKYIRRIYFSLFYTPGPADAKASTFFAIARSGAPSPARSSPRSPPYGINTYSRSEALRSRRYSSHFRLVLSFSTPPSSARRPAENASADSNGDGPFRRRERCSQRPTGCISTASHVPARRFPPLLSCGGFRWS